jgi:hypothetical protein
MSLIGAFIPTPPDMGPSRLADEQPHFLDENRQKFFFDLFAARRVTCESSGVEYLQFSSKLNMFATDKIVFRKCYDHMTPHIQHEMGPQGFGRTAVTGTPGIGKTVYGALLTRGYVLKKRSVLYWERDNIYFFSWDTKARDKFDLKKMGGNGLYYGYWDYSRQNADFYDLLVYKDAIVIHDPDVAFTKLAGMVDKQD